MTIDDQQGAQDAPAAARGEGDAAGTPGAAQIVTGIVTGTVTGTVTSTPAAGEGDAAAGTPGAAPLTLGAQAALTTNEDTAPHAAMPHQALVAPHESGGGGPAYVHSGEVSTSLPQADAVAPHAVMPHQATEEPPTVAGDATRVRLTPTEEPPPTRRVSFAADIPEYAPVIPAEAQPRAHVPLRETAAALVPALLLAPAAEGEGDAARTVRAAPDTSVERADPTTTTTTTMPPTAPAVPVAPVPSTGEGMYAGDATTGGFLARGGHGV